MLMWSEIGLVCGSLLLVFPLSKFNPRWIVAAEKTFCRIAQRRKFCVLFVGLLALLARAAVLPVLNSSNNHHNNRRHKPAVRAAVQWGIQGHDGAHRESIPQRGLRGDWLTSASLMDSFLTGSNDALAAGDIVAAKDYMEKAERQIDEHLAALSNSQRGGHAGP